MPIELLREVSYRFARPWLTWRVRSRVDPDGTPLVKLGTSYGGWILPESVVRAGGVAICAGAGEDISFDIELNKRGFDVFTLDPTPRSKQHAECTVRAARENTLMPINRSPNTFYDLQGFDPRRYHFEAVGLWNADATMHFFAPKNPEHVSHSIVNLQRTDSSHGLQANCMTVASFCRSRGIDRIDILKLDIEGSEYAVIGSLIESGLRPTVLCIDFDEIRIPLGNNRMERILGALDRLGKCGYKFRNLEKSNALLVRTPAGSAVDTAAAALPADRRGVTPPSFDKSGARSAGY